MIGVENVPAEIVRQLLESGSRVAARAAEQAARFTQLREQVKLALRDVIDVVPDDLLDDTDKPSVTAVDGGLVCESRSIGDFCTAVAVSAGNEVSAGGCEIWMDSVPRAPGNREMLSGVMSSMEILHAARVPGEVVMIDGALLSTLINVSKSVREARGQKTASPLRDRAAGSGTAELRDSVMEVLTSSRFIAMPKYTTTNEFASFLPAELASHDGRTLATMALSAGEMTHFAPRKPGGVDDKRMLIGPALGFRDSDAKDFSAALDGVQSCYYRPHPWTPAFRIDMSANGIDDETAMLRALRAVRDHTTTSGMREPFPLYLADLFAKQVSVGASPVVEMASISAISDPDARLLIAMGYRS